MPDDSVNLIEMLAAKEDIRELAMLYSREVDRKDVELLRGLYTADATDSHGDYFDGPASAYVDWLAASLGHVVYSGHHICNHLISVEGDAGEGEVYAIAYHILPDGNGGYIEDLQLVRYVDHYRRESGQWRFARRVVSFDLRHVLPISEAAAATEASRDLSYQTLTHRLFARGERANRPAVSAAA